MRFVIQVVDNSSVTVDGKVVGQIGKGFMVLIGVGKDDNEQIADKMIKKMTGLRIFKDENGKTNLSLSDVGGELLLISQFTLYADCRHGNRPNFLNAGTPDEANRLYDYIVDRSRQLIPVVQTGVFGERMKVSLVNDGPFTIILDSDDMK